MIVELTIRIKKGVIATEQEKDSQASLNKTISTCQIVLLPSILVVYLVFVIVAAHGIAAKDYEVPF